MNPMIYDDFWFIQAKDIIPAVIASVAFILSASTYFNTYMMKPKIISNPGNRIWLASHRGDENKFRIFVNCLFYNIGSRPALIISLKLKLAPIRVSHPSPAEVLFQWDEFVLREEVRDAGEMHHKGIRATFKGKAFALVIPETDTVEKEIVFIPVDESGALIEGDYILSLEGAFIDSGERLRKFSSSSARVTLSSQDFVVAKERIVRDSDGKYLYSNHVPIQTVPYLKEWS